MGINCPDCGRSFKSSEALNMHKNSVHSSGGSREVEKPKMSRIWLYGIIALGFVIVAVVLIMNSGSSSGQYDDFAQCLTDEGFKMFGAYWCPHCKDQKRWFGASWEFVDYIECSLPGGSGQTAECTQQGITGYPTWELPDGSRQGGAIPLEQLSALSGCSMDEEDYASP